MHDLFFVAIDSEPGLEDVEIVSEVAVTDTTTTGNRRTAGMTSVMEYSASGIA